MPGMSTPRKPSLYSCHICALPSAESKKKSTKKHIFVPHKDHSQRYLANVTRHEGIPTGYLPWLCIALHVRLMRQRMPVHVMAWNIHEGLTQPNININEAAKLETNFWIHPNLTLSSLPREAQEEREKESSNFSTLYCLLVQYRA